MTPNHRVSLPGGPWAKGLSWRRPSGLPEILAHTWVQQLAQGEHSFLGQRPGEGL